ncbi:unnamed protein product [Albugo candida]|uniref:SAC3/GANP/THP3 conserved domain-containing protein n=2 Tax=Albugo candida TaxID=65357 RepID=A0A024FZM1_9STRA|nr:unnamed protein product [Albugo candida]|eukprot:CCI39505.1 unnamed protein product [Albugo candida]
MRAKKRLPLLMHRKNTASNDEDKSVYGTCLEMCPEAEFISRKRDNLLSRFEKIKEAHDEIQYIALKAYRRPAAGRMEILLHELRPPSVLLDTLRHLFTKILQWPNGGFDSPFLSALSTENTFLSLYNFIHDRVRSVRQDFIIQRIINSTYATALEWIIRFYILSFITANAILAEKYHSEWSETLHQEQLASALYSLSSLYLTPTMTLTPHKAEMLAYRILFHIDNTEAVSLPRSTLSWPPIARALRFFTSFHCGNYMLYGKLLAEATFLEKALLLTHSVKLSKRAFQIMSKAYNKQSVPLDDVLNWLCGVDRETLVHVCRSLNIEMSTSIHFKIATISTRESRNEVKSLATYWSSERVNTTECIVKT